MEQIGWDGKSKPFSMHDRGFHQKPQLPQIPEDEEVRNSAQRGDDLVSGSALRDALSGAAYDVEGIMLPRPFKIIKCGPISLFVRDLDAATRFYTHQLGLRVSEETLGLRDDSSTLAAGFQVGSYRQLREAREFFKSRGAKFVELPSELHPGIDYAFHVLDPDGQAVQIYFSMEQIGWDGQTRPAAQRPDVRADAWPAALAEQPDVYGGESLLGPLG